MAEGGKRRRWLATRSERGGGSLLSLLAQLVIVGGLFLLAACPAIAAAETSGQIGEAWGTPGEEPGEFFDPGMFGVDSATGDIYVGDITPNLKDYRLQKLSSTGTYEASVDIPRFSNPEETKIVSLHGVAVNPTQHRLYMVEACRVSKPAGECKSFGTTLGASRLLIYSTNPEGTHLVPPSEGPSTLPLPGGGETLYNPQSIAVDPSSGDVVLLAENGEGHSVIQKVSPTGTLVARFVDTDNILRPDSGHLSATSIAVGPSGTIYTITGGPSAQGAQFTRAWELPSDLSSVQEVPGFAMDADEEDWYTGLLSPSIGTALLGGPQLAVSPDGSTLYWKESVESSTPTEAGDVLVRGYSLTNNKTQVLYGGGTNRCAIANVRSGHSDYGFSACCFRLWTQQWRK